MNTKNQCPEFPHFGAHYPDARCIDGYLWDLDKYENGQLCGGGDDPCPFCNEDEYKEWLNYSDSDSQQKQRIDDHIKYLRKKYIL